MAELVDIQAVCENLDEADHILDSMISRVADMRPATKRILDAFHDHTEQWMASEGEGSYDRLSPDTVRNKIAAGYPQPMRPLFATGELFASAIGTGPFTVEDATNTQAFEALDWERDGWNIPALHQEGVPWELVHRRAYVTHTGKHVKATSYMWHLPARPIFTIDQPLIEKSSSVIVDHIFQP